MSHKQFRFVYLLASTVKSELKDDLVNEYINSLDVDPRTSEELREASRFYEKYKSDGVVVLKNVYPIESCLDFIDEIFSYILNLPYKQSVKDQLQKVFDELNLVSNPWQGLSKKDVKILKKFYPMTGGFGALTLPPVFHLQNSWNARQDPVIVSIFRKLLGEQDIVPTLDRVSMKYPGQGETEFCHWDSNPWHWPDEEYESIQGILSLCETTFRAVPGTNTEKFRRKFIKKYPESSRKDQYHIYSDNDPMDLLNKVQVYNLKPGDLVVWSNRCLHEARKNTTDKIRYALYLSYHPRGKPTHESLRLYSRRGIEYEKDRKKSFKTGRNPLAYPSGTEIKLYSQRAWIGAAKTLKDFCELWEEDSGMCEEREYQSGKKKGRTHPIVVGSEPRNYGYIPPKLTDLGKTLL